ncbi:PEP-utilizing enzyme, mobile domain protein [Mycobacterium intracellulare 1956]|uniref:PEP-utilizing enzyme, mobile domain protein n=1 Tax=Mycobacterium intracellulare 1956 TaxID=1299331 RepID=X8CTP3_MYCIT|nr:PEP-utilizing enzyme, mobile domain protein [Mycobacterium intracellulare 1956]
MNVDRARELAGLLPGMTGDDFERDLLGAVRPDAAPTRSDPAGYRQSSSRRRRCWRERGLLRAACTSARWTGGGQPY